MRIVNGLLCLLLVLFIAVQYNDPDGPLWMAIYAVPTVLAGLAAFRPDALRALLPTVILVISLAAAIAGTVYYWPQAEGFWRPEVWYSQDPALQEIAEMAREGMGMMVAAIALAIVAFTRWRMGGSGQGTL